MKKIIFSLLIIFTFSKAQFFISENNSIFSDIKAHNIGDVLTVYVMENANASRETEMDNTHRSDAGTSSGITGSLTGFLPVFGASAAITSQQKGSEGTKQNDRLNGKISAIIVGATENGLYEIEGKRIIEVNGEKNIMEVTGMVRSRDIEENNIVYSYKIANASIKYSKGNKKGEMATSRPGKGKRILIWTISGLMTATAFFLSGAS
ncbi:MAG: flagellar basal body L-ring protein FlgH [Candidatus Marinimicrobia bacterium]|nr:flagellar basal body L-ring protein FlgH [Candidatus Neomarinimicrobiota bacterium]